MVVTALGFVSSSRLAYRRRFVGSLRVLDAGRHLSPRRRMTVAALPPGDFSPALVLRALDQPGSSTLPVYELRPPAARIPAIVGDAVLAAAAGILLYSLVIGLALPTILEVKDFGGQHEELSARQFMKLQLLMSDTTLRQQKSDSPPGGTDFERALETEDGR